MEQQTAPPLMQTPFHGYHEEHDAKLIDFAGWEMPIRYGSIIEEHKQVRNSGGLFDVSHMGRIEFSGKDAQRFLERLLTRRVGDMAEFTCRYSLICNEEGGVKDDVIVYRFADKWMLVVNASNREKILGHLDDNKGKLKVKINDKTESTAMIALQGPKVMDIIGQFSEEVPELKRYSFCVKSVMTAKIIISRTGYTGEDGVEVILPAKLAGMALKMLLKDPADTLDIKPSGLGARDSLRIEAAMSLYGHELDEDTDPFAAGLGFAISLDKDKQDDGEPFIGQEALKKFKADGPQRQLVGIKLKGRRTPRQGNAIYKDGEQLGAVTSGCLSPTLGHPIAMAYVTLNACTIGDKVLIAAGSSRVDGEIIGLPFYKRA
jgi:glycine cleavage system T protein (aminomethyltransferase)